MVTALLERQTSGAFTLRRRPGERRGGSRPLALSSRPLARPCPADRAADVGHRTLSPRGPASRRGPPPLRRDAGDAPPTGVDQPPSSARDLIRRAGALRLSSRPL